MNLIEAERLLKKGCKISHFLLGEGRFLCLDSQGKIVHYNGGGFNPLSCTFQELISRQHNRKEFQSGWVEYDDKRKMPDKNATTSKKTEEKVEEKNEKGFDFNTLKFKDSFWEELKIK